VAPPGEDAELEGTSFDVALFSFAAVGGATSVSPPKPKASDGSAAAGMPASLRSLPSVADRLTPSLASTAAAAGGVLPPAARLSSTAPLQQLQQPAAALTGSSPAAAAAAAAAHAGSSPVAASTGALKPVVYDPRQVYNPAYHLQPKSSTVTVPAAAALSSAAAVGSLLDNTALLLPLSKVSRRSCGRC